jgi:hypothetical protein
LSSLTAQQKLQVLCNQLWLAGEIGIKFGILTIDLSHEWGMSRFIKDSNSKNNGLRATVGFKL